MAEKTDVSAGRPLVGLVMGSDSDMPVMAKAADILEELGIPYEMAIISASGRFFLGLRISSETIFRLVQPS